MSFYDELPGWGNVAAGAAGVPLLEGCVAPPLPPRPGGLLGSEEVAEADRHLWDMLQQEGYRQRGEGFRSDWAFHRLADDDDLGYPLAHSARMQSGGKEYAFQVFARDTLCCAVPNWGEVQRLSSLAGAAMPAEGLALDVLRASYTAVGQELKPEWRSHQVALAEQLGPAMSGAYRVTVEGQEYSLQVFACDVIYFVPPNWQDAQRLSSTAAGPLRQALLAEAAKATGQQLDLAGPIAAVAGVGVGVPLSGVYAAGSDGAFYSVQVFALDTVYIPAEGGEAKLQSGLRTLRGPLAPSAVVALSDRAQPGGSGPADALSDRRPVFGMLPTTGQPPISQFYGYTRFAATGGRQYYGATQGMHSGLDFAVDEGTELLAINYGVVLRAGEGCPFGASIPQSIVVRYGSIYALYGHASAVHVRPGQQIAPGEVIGLSGAFGGPHLHFELRPVPSATVDNTDPGQAPQNPGFALNPLECFSPDLRGYFERKLVEIGGRSDHFCTGDMDQQPRITFGNAVNASPCT